MFGYQYRQTRNYENLQRVMFAGVGPLGIPPLEPTPAPEGKPEWISFNFMRGDTEPEKHGLHFFIDDYQFIRLWDNPEAYTEKLRRYQAVCTPDFSLYTDFPLAVQQFNHFRKHWLGAYWQMHGLQVIPTICWSDTASFDWCFDGEPKNSCVAVSSVGTQNKEATRKGFLAGYRAMMERLTPTHIIFYGDVPDECEADKPIMTIVPPFTSKWLGTV